MVTAFIPLRSGSKSIPGKNIRSFCGRPLVFWCLDALEKASLVDKIIVAVDSQEFQHVIEGFGLKKVSIYWRDPQNAADNSSTESVMLEYLNKYKHDDNELFMVVQATSPFTRAFDFDSAIKQLTSSEADSLLSCVRTKRFFWTEEGQPINYDYRIRPRRQDFDGLLMENGAFYINSVGNIQHDENRLSGEVAIYEMPEHSAIEIDEEIDWIIAERLMTELLKMDAPKHDIKLFLMDVDGTLTDAGMYYDQFGNELKKFNTHDGKGIELLRKAGIKTGIITSENTEIVKRRAEKLKVDYLYQGLEHQSKLQAALEICEKEGISLNQVAYIGDDVNCIELLEAVGLSAIPANATSTVISLQRVTKLTQMGGHGAVREFADLVLSINKN